MRRKLCGLALVSVMTVVAALASLAGATGTPPPPPEPGSFSCRASALRVRSPIVNSEPTVANPGQVPCADDFKEVLNAAVPPFVTASVINARTDLDPGGVPGGHAEASTTSATVTVGGQVITARILSATADAQCRAGQPFLTGSSAVVGLVINGKPTNVVSNPVTIPVSPLVVVAINEQTKTSDTITQRALHVFSPLLGVDIVISEAIADVEQCRPAGPTTSSTSSTSSSTSTPPTSAP